MNTLPITLRNKPENSASNQHRHFAQWALLLVGLVIITCLSKTLSVTAQFGLSEFPVSESIAVSAQPFEQEIQTLYKHTFSQSDNEHNGTATQSTDSCSLATQLLPQVLAKVDWLVPFIILTLFAYVVSRSPSQRLARQKQNTPTPKRRLHVTHCVFQE